MDKISIKNITDDSTFLSIFEPLPFPIKRIYWFKDMKYFNIRGKHAHKVTDQVVICLQGACTIHLETQDNKKENFKLFKDNGFILWHYYWHTIELFSDDCLLMVLASEEYNEQDYIRNYEQFKKTVFKH